MNTGRLAVWMLVLIASFSRFAAGQDRRWELEAFGGGLLSGGSLRGSGNLPEPGQTFQTFGVVQRSSRRVSSWSFGDGAVLLNDVLATAPIVRSQRITPLDPVLTTSIGEYQNGGSFGARVRRRLNSRLSVEFSAEGSSRTFNFTPAALAGIEATRATFVSTWNALLPPATAVVSAVSDTPAAGARQILTLGALNAGLRKEGLLVPYITAGLGIAFNTGPHLNAGLTGSYSFALQLPPIPGLPPVVIQEADTVAIHVRDSGRNLAGVLGGGVRINVKPRWGLNIGLRVYPQRRDVQTFVDATPSVVKSTIGGGGSVIAGNPNVIQFSTLESIPSSLSGPSLTRFKTFEGSGWEHQTSVSSGLFFRF